MDDALDVFREHHRRIQVHSVTFTIADVKQVYTRIQHAVAVVVSHYQVLCCDGKLQSVGCIGGQITDSCEVNECSQRYLKWSDR